MVRKFPFAHVFGVGSLLCCAAGNRGDRLRLPHVVGGVHRLEGMRHGYGNCEVVQRGEGFAFIAQGGGGADVLAHYSAINSSCFRELQEGQP